MANKISLAPLPSPVLAIPEGSPEIHIKIQRDRAVFDPAFTLSQQHRVSMATYRAYARGHHRIVLTDKQKTILRALLGNRFCDNICDQVLSSASSRLDLQRWDCEDQSTKTFLDDWYVSSKIRADARNVHYNTLRDGNHVLALGWNNTRQTVSIYMEDWWDGYQGVFIAYNADAEMVYGVKEWPVVDRDSFATGVKRRNIWFEDRLERWQGNGGTWTPAPLPEDNGVWPIPWLKKDGTPLHIPYVHFANGGKGQRIYGFSDIDGIIGLQDQMNDLQFAMSGAGRLTAYQMLYMTGISPYDDKGNKIDIEVGPGKVFTSPKEGSQFGTLPAGDLSQLISLYHLKQNTISIRTRTPLYELSDENLPSGEAIYQAQTPAIAKASENVDKFTPAWTNVAVRAADVYNRYHADGQPDIPVDMDKAKIHAVMAGPERRDKLTMSVVINNISGFISNREALRLLGYTPEQIEEIMDEKSQETQQQQADMLASFDKGLSPGTGLPPIARGNPAGGTDPSTPPGKGGAAGGIGGKKPTVGAGTGKHNGTPPGGKAS